STTTARQTQSQPAPSPARSRALARSGPAEHFPNGRDKRLVPVVVDFFPVNFIEKCLGVTSALRTKVFQNPIAVFLMLGLPACNERQDGKIIKIEFLVFVITLHGNLVMFQFKISWLGSF